MPGLVFVRDLQGRPLMPMSAAYARTLIQRGKGQLHVYPAWSVIQLTREVPTPVLRPVLAGIALRRTTADVWLLIDQARKQPSLLHLIVDLRTDHRVLGHRTRAFPGIRRETFLRWPLVWWPAYLVAAVVAAIRNVLPISHVIVVPPDSTTINHMHRMMMHRIARTHMVERPTLAVLDRLSGPPPNIMPGLWRLLIDLVQGTDARRPNMVVYAVQQGWPLDQTGKWSRRQGRSWHVDQLQRSQQDTGALRTNAIEQVGTIYERGKVVTGIIERRISEPRTALRVPIVANSNGVQWRSLPVPRHTKLHVWPLAPIAFLPLDQSLGQKGQHAPSGEEGT